MGGRGGDLAHGQASALEPATFLRLIEPDGIKVRVAKMGFEQGAAGRERGGDGDDG